MQKYVGVKMVQAEPETKDGKEGFKVVYEEGYESWCPQDVFLKHNWATDDVPFAFALEAAKRGRKITRKGWNGKGQYVFLIPGGVIKREEIPALKDEPGEISFLGCFCIKTTDGRVQLGWLATQSDMQASDWEILG
jgi:hypothetical protein